MKISLRPIKKSNWEECIQLKVSNDQEGNMASKFILHCGSPIFKWIFMQSYLFGRSDDWICNVRNGSR